MSASATSSQWRRSTSCDEPRKARAAKTAKIAYSVKCAALRTIRCMMPIVSSLMRGKNQSSNGSKTFEVFEPENSAVEAKKIKPIHSRSGAYRRKREVRVAGTSAKSSGFISSNAHLALKNKRKPSRVASLPCCVKLLRLPAFMVIEQTSRKQLR